MLSATGPNSLFQAPSIPHQTHTAIVALSTPHNAANSALSLSQKSVATCLCSKRQVSFSHASSTVTAQRRTRPMLRTAKRSSQHKSPLVPAITATTQKTGPRHQEKHALTENHNSYSKTHAFRRRNPLFHNRRSPLKKSHISAGFRQCSHHASHNHCLPNNNPLLPKGNPH